MRVDTEFKIYFKFKDQIPLSLRVSKAEGERREHLDGLELKEVKRGGTEKWVVRGLS